MEAVWPSYESLLVAHHPHPTTSVMSSWRKKQRSSVLLLLLKTAALVVLYCCSTIHVVTPVEARTLLSLPRSFIPRRIVVGLTLTSSSIVVLPERRNIHVFLTNIRGGSADSDDNEEEAQRGEGQEGGG